MRLFIIFLLSSLVAASQDKIEIRGFVIEIGFSKDGGVISVKQKGNLVSSQILKTDRQPSIKKMQHVRNKGGDFLLLDMDRGYTFGSMHETHCSEVSLWKFTAKGHLKLIQTELYQCDVNSSNEYYKAKEFYRPYFLNTKIPLIEFKKVP